MAENTVHARSAANDYVEELQDENLPPVDRGWPAWSCAIGGWLCEALLWGNHVPRSVTTTSCILNHRTFRTSQDFR